MPKKDCNVISSLVGKGLEREAILLKDLFTQHDIYTNVMHYLNWANIVPAPADFNIFLEVINPLGFSLSRENWLFPNCEWWDARNDQFVNKFTKICCKTKDCERIWKNKVRGDRPERVVYTGFEVRDLYDPSVVREDRVLHVAGQSEFKNTEAVIEAWARGGSWACKPLPLTVVTQQKKYQDLCANLDPKMLVTCVSGKIPDNELQYLMNSHRFHLLPSAYEGYGHALREGIACAALVLTTAAPPMNETAGIMKDWTVKVNRTEPRALAQLNQVTWIDVQVACNKAFQAVNENQNFNSRSQQARDVFLQDRAEFRERILKLVGV